MPGHVPMPMPMSVPMPQPGYVHYRTDSKTGAQVPYIIYHNGEPYQTAALQPLSSREAYPQDIAPMFPVQPAQGQQTVHELPANICHSRAGTETSQQQAPQQAPQPAAPTSVAQSLASPPRVVYAQPMPHPGGLPQSQSHASGLFNNAALASPEKKTPSKKASGDDSGLICSPTERLTEPRNYAPRSGGVQNHHPPTWELAASERADAMKKAGMEDPFVSDNTRSSALVHTPGGPTQQSVAGVRSKVCELPGESRSQHLNKLLQDGLPPFDIAMDPDNFPFAESCRTGPAVNYGVIRIRNVSLALSPLNLYLLIFVTDSLLHEACRGHRFPWSQLQDFERH